MPQARIQDDAFVAKLRSLFQLKYQRDLEFALAGEGVDDAFFVRAVNYHQCMVPWIETVFPLKGTAVVEIGGGAGAATLAVAQKCAQTDSFDIDKASLDLGAYRAGFMGCENVRLHLMSPDWALPQRIAESKGLFPKACDVVLLPAILEHMKLEERLAVLEMLWSILRPGGIMVVYDTPNRLYGYDMHSFRLPFFNWLPDDLALLYASRSSRSAFPALLAKSASPMETLYRLGRGVSYHEFDLAIGLSEFEAIQDGYSNLLKHRGINDFFEGTLMHLFERYAPHVPAAFSKQFLEMVLRKKWHKMELLERNLARDEMVDGKRPALMLEGNDACLKYRVGQSTERMLAIEAVKHPWSSVLLVCDESGQPFHQFKLHSEYAITELLEVALPEGMREVQLRLKPDPRSLGNQAWVLGAGMR